MERVGWGRGTKTRPKTYSILSNERTPTDTHNPLSYTELATEGQGARGEGGRCDAKAFKRWLYLVDKLLKILKKI